MTLTAFAIGNKSGSAAAMSMAFGVLGMSQIFHCYNNKSAGSVLNGRIFSNRFMNFSAVLALFIVIFLLLTPAGYVFGMTVLSFKQFMFCVMLSVLVIPFCEILKLIKHIAHFE